MVTYKYPKILFIMSIDKILNVENCISLKFNEHLMQKHKHKTVLLIIKKKNEYEL